MHFLPSLDWQRKYKSGAYYRVSMVFINTDLNAQTDGNGKWTGLVTVRDTGKFLGLLLLESIFGVLVIFSNLLIIIILIIGWKRLVKNHFYIVLSNLIVCTTLKAIIELAFIIPYYVMQATEEKKLTGYFSTQYELLIFNASVFADYGVLFFSVLIAINRFLAVTRPPEDARSSSHYQGIQTAMSCAIVWLLSALIPVLFFLFQCQYAYSEKLKVYRNQCAKLYDDILICLFNCVIYLSYACAAIVLVLYLVIFLALRRQRLAMRNVNRKSPITQMQRLRQSVIVFVLYAMSILSVFAMSFARPSGAFDAFDIAYTENLLNLSIAAVYPICFLATSGEMRNILVRKFAPARNSRVSSVHLSGVQNRIPANETKCNILPKLKETCPCSLVPVSSTMVFVNSGSRCTYGCKGPGMVMIRDTGKYIALVVLEAGFGVVVAASNLFLITIMVIGGRRLMKSNGMFSKPYELLFFNLSAFADYGVLFFSVLIAVNRFIIISGAPEGSRLKTALSSAVVWFFSATIPVLLFLFECQFVYNDKVKTYQNQCGRITNDILLMLLDCLTYIAYACAALVLILYLLILRVLWRQSNSMKISSTKSRGTDAQMQLLKQSIVVFALYAASIACVFVISFVEPDAEFFGVFEIAYIENLLNLSIAAVYPICFLSISGELKSIIVRKFIVRNSIVSSVRLSGTKNRIAKRESIPGI